MLSKIHAWLMRHTKPIEPIDKELYDLAGLNGYAGEIAAIKQVAEKKAQAGKKRTYLRVVG